MKDNQEAIEKGTRTLYQFTKDEQKEVDSFLRDRLGAIPQGEPSAEDLERVRLILTKVEALFDGVKYILGLTIDFAVFAHQLQAEDPELVPLSPSLSHEDILRKYPNQAASSLTIQPKKKKVAIRPSEERVRDAFHRMLRSEYPKAAAHATGEWSRYVWFLDACLRLTEAGRAHLIRECFRTGLSRLPEDRFHLPPTPRVRLFELVVGQYPRKGKGEPGGLTLQAVVYGYVMGNYGHLQVVADKVRTGSARQKRFGDVSCYHGLNLELCLEAKDLVLDEHNYEAQVADFVRQAAKGKLTAVVVAVGFSDWVKSQLALSGVSALTLQDLGAAVRTWDWQKQENALSGMLHYLAHVERNPTAVERLLAFIAKHDPGHPSTQFLQLQEAEPEATS